MAESGKKISFSFSKVVKPPRITKGLTKDANDKQYIDCLDSKSIIVKNDEVIKNDEGPKEIIIPLRNPTVARSSAAQMQKNADGDNAEVKNEALGNGVVSLDDIAAKELLEESKRISEQQKKENANILEIPTPQSEENLQKESTLEDYEMIPVEAFGKAMLRGMGWTAGKGIGKQGKVASTATPQLRPRGMGLGADKTVSKASTSNSKKEEEEQELELLKGSYMQMVSGARKGQYGEVQGMDEDAGRLVVKMALNGDCVSVSEHAVRVVSKKEYEKNSRVLNVAKFDDYKKRSERREDSHGRSSERNSDRHHNYSSKKRHKRSPSPSHKHSRHRNSS